MLPLALTLEVVPAVIVVCPFFDEFKAPERMEMLQHGDGEFKLAWRRQWDGAAAGFHSPQWEGEGGLHLVDGHRGQEIEPTRGHGKELAPLLFCGRLEVQLPLLRCQTTCKTIVQRGQVCEGERGAGGRAASPFTSSSLRSPPDAASAPHGQAGDGLAMGPMVGVGCGAHASGGAAGGGDGAGKGGCCDAGGIRGRTFVAAAGTTAAPRTPAGVQADDDGGAATLWNNGTICALTPSGFSLPRPKRLCGR